MKKFNKEQKRQIANLAAKKDADIDLSEMPEIVDWTDAEVGKFYRPPKKPVTMHGQFVMRIFRTRVTFHCN